MTVTIDKLGPLRLPYWPTCQDALCWSSEVLAVAAGELVHLLTPRDYPPARQAPHQKQWHDITVRINQFEGAEWPHQDMARLQDFSLGEELSESSIVSLAWSPPGLGLHKRSILTILTSNLVLSFWETNGTLGFWKRTCVVNQHLREGASSDDQAQSRRRGRVRAFCWLPPVVPGPQATRGPQLLAVADDSMAVSLFRVVKADPAKLGTWSFELMTRKILDHSAHEASHTPTPRSLRALLAATSPISKLKASPWHLGDKAANLASSKIEVSLGQCRKPKHLVVHVGETRRGKNAPSRGLKLFITESESESGLAFGTEPPAELFEAATKRLWQEFNEKFSLGGAVRVRHWGTTTSPDQIWAAACMTMHPSDMQEYGNPSTQVTYVVFARIREDITAAGVLETATAVREAILNFIAKKPIAQVTHDLDQKMIRCAIALITWEFQDSPQLVQWAESARTSSNTRHARHPDAMDVDPADDARDNPPEFFPEACEICRAPIPFSNPSAATKCTRGHQFTRCNLSFVTIQEPGISKYCTKCSKQFLDLGKMELPEGPSAIRELHEEFDVCPYCRGMFRG